jgi:hypothetical protein
LAQTITQLTKLFIDKMANNKLSNKLRDCAEQIRDIELQFRQVTESSKLNWTDRRQQEFFSKYIQKQSDALDELHRELNMIYFEVSQMESSLSRFK